MVQTIHEEKEYYQCIECGMRYAEREWAEKCEAWCKEHKSCNLDIISHAISAEHSGAEAVAPADTALKTPAFYGAIGIAASLGLLLVFYWSLRLNSSIGSLVSSTYDKPLYFWPYVLLTFGTIVLFGINAPLLVYRWRRFGRPKLKKQAGGGLGSLVGVVASACPICGSVFLSAIGIAGGLSAFPFGGLELKALSFGLMALPLFLMRRDMKNMEAGCAAGTCLPAKDASFNADKDRRWLAAIVFAIIFFAVVGWNMVKSDPIVSAFAVSSFLDYSLYS